ncbi:heme NO-binding domain-containing protein [Roseiconus lacunae]|uniref:heme NO-binding domain-containing protein n=1 Tax=Roseiconus lacunae TaxID=2605694 RepID=UPI0011F2A880|nr:heme NO-binding domain-containing protein [Roseiconus lacunae]MCD0460188.1 heme NO-binding domain-containing protein [Roseiconus lacunae]
MKGIVFTELIEMVETNLGLEIADRMILNANTPNQGAYTSVGTYDHMELIRLVVALSDATQVPVPQLVQAFGKHLFGRFAELYPQFFTGIDSTFEFLPLVESFIHVEVQKLYPDAELPTFRCEQTDERFEMTYQSSHPFADLAEGLIQATVEHFGDELKIRRTDLGEKNGTEARFTLTPSSVPESRATQTCLN